MARVLFVCTQNAGRSQMSEGFFRKAAGTGHEAKSAGTNPAAQVHAAVIAAMREEGVDLSPARPTVLTPELERWAEIVVTMGCGDTCPVIPGRRYVEWDVRDPAGQRIEVVRSIRDDLKGRVQALLQELG
jgi:arsenate reductase